MQSRRISRRAFTSAAAFSAAALAVPMLRAQARPEKPRLTLAVDGKQGLDCLPLTVAEQLGYFRAEGLELEIIDIASTGRRLPSFAGVGAGADVLCGPFEHTIELHARGLPVQAFVLQGRAPQVAVGVSLRALPGFRDMADLKGHRMGVSAAGTPSSLVANAVLVRAGINVADVSFVGVGTAYSALSAMRSGQIEALSNTDPVMTALEQRGEIRLIGDTRTLKGTEDVFGGPMPASCLYAPLEFVQKNPATCQALANGVVRALKWLQTAGPRDLIRTVPEPYFQGDRALYLAAFDKVRESISPDGLITPKGARTALRAVMGLAPLARGDRVDPLRTFSNEFSLRAKGRFHA
jgi:NitT/TauT family transport system substrate-binding protein